MKYLGKLILILIIVIPIILCVVTLNKVWSEDEYNDNINAGKLDDDYNSGEHFFFDEFSGDNSETSGEMAGEQFSNVLGNPISKIYTDAKVAISVANVYAESKETAEIVGTLEKYAIVTAQKYPDGWSRVTNNTLSGWMRTENITFPEGSTNLSTNVKIGKIKAEPYLNMRASANASAAIITTIPNGTEVTIKEEVTGWYKVTYASSIGWISADYVEIK